jgi:mannose-6-phosphate isomerase-like protein (cupin superfamily)
MMMRKTGEKMHNLHEATVVSAATASVAEKDWRPGVDSLTMFPPEEVNGLGLYSIRYAPGSELELHCHDPESHEGNVPISPENAYYKDEYYIIESGSGVVSLDGADRKVTAGDVVWIPRGTVHGVKAGPEGLHIWAMAAWLNLVNRPVVETSA